MWKFSEIMKGQFWLQFYRSTIKFLDAYSGWITWPAGLTTAVLGTWSQLSSFKIFNWRPEDKYFFYGLFATYIASGIVSKIRKVASDIKTKELNDNFTSRIKYYEDTIRQERIDSLNDHLREIAEHPSLNLGMEERICVYRYVESENAFECVGRYSRHPEYNTLSGRKLYPANMGIIAHVWSQGRFNGFKRDQSIPDISQSKQRYFDYLNNTYSIPRVVAKHFRMNPRDICAEVIRDTKDRAVGVIIFESQRQNFLNEANLRAVYTESKKGFIISSLEKLKEQKSPDLRIAREARL